MKKIVAFGIAFALFTFAASAQRDDAGFRNDRKDKRVESRQLTRGEKSRIHKNHAQYQRTERKFRHDGKFSRMEKRKLHKMRHHNRRDAFRFKHNRRHRMHS